MATKKAFIPHNDRGIVADNNAPGMKRNVMTLESKQLNLAINGSQPLTREEATIHGYTEQEIKDYFDPPASEA